MTRLEIAARIAAGVVSGLSPLNIAEFSLEVADELIKLEAETRPEIVVGGVYEMLNGEIEEIVSKDDFYDYPFKGASGRMYSIEGIWIGDTTRKFDLVKRIR